MISIDLEALADALAERMQQTGTPWMSTTEAAEHLRASERWLRDRLHEIPHRRVDGKLFFNRQELDAWLTNQPRR